MYNPSTQGVIIFIVGVSFLLLLFISFIITIVYKYQQKQNAYFKELEALKITHENELLQSQIEIQEQTFQNISREIHDNIGQMLTLAKFNINTLDLNNGADVSTKAQDTVALIGEAISDLSDLSRSLSSEMILANGLIKALEYEIEHLQKFHFRITLNVSEDVIFLEAKKELIIFRIIQEALNNIVKHAQANEIKIDFHYGSNNLQLKIEDDGVGFVESRVNAKSAGLNNMKKRAHILGGNFTINAHTCRGTILKIKIPIP